MSKECLSIIGERELNMLLIASRGSMREPDNQYKIYIYIYILIQCFMLKTTAFYWRFLVLQLKSESVKS